MRFTGAAALMAAALSAATPARQIAWDDLSPALQTLAEQHGISRRTFAESVARVRARNQARVREGELDALVYYALQSTEFTTLPPIEPALSAKAFVESGTVPRDAEARLDAFVDAIAGSERTRPTDHERTEIAGPERTRAAGNGEPTSSNVGRVLWDPPRRDARFAYFRDVLARERLPVARQRAFLAAEYTRAMRFLYDKEFVAARDADAAAATARLYQRRGLSTDTSVEAGFVIDLALATLHELEPQRRFARVLIVGPGLDLAPRTGFTDEGRPQSDQPFLVIDALLRRGLADPGTLRVVGADINPHVVEWLQRIKGTRPRLTLVGAIQETDRVRFTAEYRDYFAAIGQSIGERSGHALDVRAGIADLVGAAPLDVAVDRLDERFDLVVVTNVFPYLSDADLLLAIVNVARMLAPGGILLHNEPRPLLATAGPAAGLSLIQSRSAIIANVAGRSPLYDAIWMHRKDK